MNLRFVQRQPGGPKVLQYRAEHWDGHGWQDIPLVEEWRATPQTQPPPAVGYYRSSDGADYPLVDLPIYRDAATPRVGGSTVPSMRDALVEMADEHPASRRHYHDMD